MQQLLAEIRYGIRQLGRDPGFTLTAIITLALGIGVNTALFSVVEAVMLRPLPYPDPESLVSFEEAGGGPFRSVRPANLADYARSRTLSVVHIGDIAMNLTGDGAPERVFGTRATGNFFDVLGVGPAFGRPFTLQDDRYGAPHVVVLADRFWRERFGADPHIIGKSIRLNGEPYQVLGVMPAGWESPAQFTARDPLQFFVPACFDPELLRDRGSGLDTAIARLRPGVPLAEARAEFQTISRRLAHDYPDTMKDVRVVLQPERTKLASHSRTSLLVLLGAVGLILLLACANVANLLLARSTGQRREFAVRIALGARRSRVMRELLVQTALLAGAGCAIGLVAAAWIERLLISLAPGDIPRLQTAGLNWLVLLFTLVICGGTVLVFGLAPAWLVSGADPQAALHGSSMRSTANRSILRSREILMTGELALSLALLIGAGLMLKSFLLLRGVRLGFEPERVVAMNITLPEPSSVTQAQHRDTDNAANAAGTKFEPTVDPDALRRLRFFEQLTARVQAIPGVELAAFGRFPLRGHWMSSYEQEEHPLRNPGDSRSIELDSQPCSVDYFRTLGIPLLRGRAFDANDRTETEPVIIVNEAYERTYYPHESALGHRLRKTNLKQWRRIVGVVADAHFYGQDQATKPATFLPAAQVDSYPIHIADFAVRSALPISQIVPAVRQAVWSLDPNQPITRIKTLAETVSESQKTRRFQTTLLVLFAALALSLALVGIYGVVAYNVEQRTSEIGIRMALGAQRTGILDLILRETMRLAFVGISAGLIAALALSRTLSALLFEVKPVELTTYASVSVLLALAVLAAAFLPARRASRTEPLVALRHE